MTSHEVKQDFFNRALTLTGRMVPLIGDIDDAFLVGLLELEHLVKTTRGHLAMRRVLDIGDDTEDDL